MEGWHFFFFFCSVDQGRYCWTRYSGKNRNSTPGTRTGERDTRADAGRAIPYIVSASRRKVGNLGTDKCRARSCGVSRSLPKRIRTSETERRNRSTSRPVNARGSGGGERSGSRKWIASGRGPTAQSLGPGSDRPGGNLPWTADKQPAPRKRNATVAEISVSVQQRARRNDDVQNNCDSHDRRTMRCQPSKTERVHHTLTVAHVSQLRSRRRLRWRAREERGRAAEMADWLRRRRRWPTAADARWNERESVTGTEHRMCRKCYKYERGNRFECQ